MNNTLETNLELYKIFYTVANEHSFSKAAKLLFVSQSAVSQSIKTLEQQLHYPLFNRSTKEITLTPAGELLYSYIGPALTLVLEVEERLLHPDLVKTGSLHIGASDTICRYFLLPYLKVFHQKYPNVSLKVTNQTSIKCASLLETGAVDLIIVNSPNTYLLPEFILRPLMTFTDQFIGGSTYEFLSQDTHSLADLHSYPLLTLDASSSTSEYLKRLFQTHHLDYLPAFELGSNDLLIDLAKINLGIAFVPTYCLPTQSLDLFPITIKEPLPTRQLIGAYSKVLPLTHEISSFMNLLPTSSD